MSRRALAIAVGFLGFVVAGLTLVGLLVMGSLFADASTDRITGPGVDIFLRTPFTGEHGTIVLDVEARGGSRAGIKTIAVSDDHGLLAKAFGEGMSWGAMITSGKSRGSETVTVTLDAPPTAKAGATLPLAIRVASVVAMSSDGGFVNEPHDDTVLLDVPIYSDAGRHLAQLRCVGIALGCFLIWFLIVWGTAALYARAEAREPFARSSEAEGIGILMGLLGGTVTGYWVFAWRLMKVLETQATFFAAVFTILWVVVPLGFAYRWRKRRPILPRPLATRRGAEPDNDAPDDAPGVGWKYVGGIGHDSGEVPARLLLEICKSRVADVVAKAPPLADVTTWIDRALAGDDKTLETPGMRRRVLALNWVLDTIAVAMHAPAIGPNGEARRAALVGFVLDALTLADNAERDALATRVLACLRET